MASIAVAPFTMKNVLLTIGTDSYEKHVSAVEFVPSTSVITWKGLTPSSVFTDQSSATWVCNLTFAQDWDTTDSLSSYLFENEGDSVTIEFEPVNGGDSFSATVIITPGSIGGQVDSTAVATVQLGVDGVPTRTAAGA